MAKPYTLKLPSGKQNVRGEIYELYCYDKIIEKYPDITFFLKANKNKKAYLNSTGFNYVEPCRVVYSSNRIDLGEFDILGFKGNVMYWWEATLNKDHYPIYKKIAKKQELMQRLFPNFEIKLSIIRPFLDEELKNYHIEVIPEPDYQSFHSSKYVFKSDMSKCLDLSYLDEMVSNYDYISEVIEKSKTYFNLEKINFNSILIERLYDIENICQPEFTYYDVIKKRYGKIQIIDNFPYKNGERIKKIKSTYKEINKIRKRYLEQQQEDSSAKKTDDSIGTIKKIEDHSKSKE